jgi:hypothetical protein
MGEVRQLRSNSTSIARQLVQRAKMWLSGVTHDGARDLYAQFGYERFPENRHFVAKYHRQGIAKRIVNAPVLATWTDPPTVTTSNQNFMDAWEDLAEETKFWAHLIRLDKLARLGRYAVMVIGYDDGGRLDQPVRKSLERKVLYLQPYHEGAVDIQKYEEDSSNKRYGKPVLYNISPNKFHVDGISVQQPTGASTMVIRKPFLVHHSRLVHVAANLLEDSTFGTSDLECVNNDLDDILKVSGGSAEVFWLTANRGMQVDLDKEINLDPEEADALKQEVDDYQNQLGRIIKTRGVKITNLGSDPPSPKDAYDVLVQQISSATGIPQLVLQGAASGHLSSQQDRASWSERVAEGVTEYAEPVVLRPCIENFVEAGALPQPRDLQIHWPEAFKMNPLERGQASAQMARSAANLAKSHAAMQPTDAEGNPEAARPLFTEEEMRQIVSFGRHPPVFANNKTTKESTAKTAANPDQGGENKRGRERNAPEQE